MIGTILLSVWIGGIIGGATIAVGSGQNKGWTVAAGLLLLAVWPFMLFMVSMYALCGAKMDSFEP
jgi:hypothetical protein